MNRKSLAVIGILGLALGLVIGTALQRWRAPRPDAKSNGARIYAMDVAISSMPFWTEPKQTWQRIGSTVPGVQTSFGGPSDSDPSKQIEEMETLLSTRVNGIVVFSTDPNALVTTINKAVDKGIPVVTVFADVPKSKRLAYVGANQSESAKAVARLTMTDFPGLVKPNTKVLIVVGKIGAEDQDARRKGFEEEVGSRMHLVTPVIDNYSPDTATEVIRAALNRDPDIKVIFGCDSQSAIGAISALKELGKGPGDVIVTGWDSESVVLSEIKASAGAVAWVHATAVLYSSYMVQTAFSLLEADHFGYLYPGTANRSDGSRIPAAPRTIEIPIRIVTASNIDDFLSGQAEAPPRNTANVSQPVK